LITAERIGDRERFARAEEAVVIQVGEDGPAGDAGLAGVADPVAVQVLELGPGDGDVLGRDDAGFEFADAKTGPPTRTRWGRGQATEPRAHGSLRVSVGWARAGERVDYGWTLGPKSK
jgi:hypothetical protein